jgi:hypothetical protein
MALPSRISNVIGSQRGESCARSDQMKTLNMARIVLMVAAGIAVTPAFAQPETPSVGGYGRTEDQRVIREVIVNGRLTRADAPWIATELQQERASELDDQSASRLN